MSILHAANDHISSFNCNTKKALCKFCKGKKGLQLLNNSFLQKVLNASSDNLMRSLRDNPQQKYPIQLHFAVLNPKTLFEY